ncbi:hypothetical protein AVEN_133047-1 [Araneus ventricosus]|uniref:Ig-like domain-containing protein n=1 Tax=Araneus ventricosus TaxID=182803 RepID=A0A4Y2RS70_ARAVE|nr:hypothetical protein AVEN_133047-1 [Araneus ventricosus]
MTVASSEYWLNSDSHGIFNQTTACVSFVADEPSFSISREPGFGLPLLESMRVSLRCEVDANPPSDPIWVRDDGPLTISQDSQGFLNFTPVAHEHAGWYRCTTHHEFGFFASFGYFLNVRTAELPVSSDDGNTQLPNGLGQSTNIGCIPDGIFSLMLFIIIASFGLKIQILYS